MTDIKYLNNYGVELEIKGVELISINPGPTENNWPDPTPEMLDDPRFNAIWQAIKTWDINVPHAYEGYCEATGNHARAILDALRPDPLEALKALITAVTYHAPPKDFGTPEEPNLCWEARVPIEFVTRANEALSSGSEATTASPDSGATSLKGGEDD